MVVADFNTPRPFAQYDCWTKVLITLKIPLCSLKRVMAFHEKAGRSQVGSSLLFDKVFLLPSGPLSPCFLFDIAEKVYKVTFHQTQQVRTSPSEDSVSSTLVRLNQML